MLKDKIEEAFEAIEQNDIKNDRLTIIAKHIDDAISEIKVNSDVRKQHLDQEKQLYDALNRAKSIANNLISRHVQHISRG